MSRAWSAFALAILLCFTAGQWSVARPKPVKLSLARRLVDVALPQVKSMANRLEAVVKRRCIRPGTLGRVMVVVNAYRAEITRIINERLSLRSLRALVDLYGSPLGKKWLAIQPAVARGFGRAVRRFLERRNQGERDAKPADAVPLKKVDLRKLAAARALGRTYRIRRMMALSTSSVFRKNTGLTTEAMAELWSRLVAGRLSLTDIVRLDRTLRDRPFQDAMTAMPGVINEARRRFRPYGRRLKKILDGCR
ncbi:MAG: DUF2059 domain-containing protein [Proteobacteria bacterium]|nr:DUF2059 domain-containing protein [Pseudomonadota bacterium]